MYRFKSTPNAVLLATDIAARGLDVPDIDHVIHYQIPRTADAYIHRNGRTARAMREGFSMLMCAPDEKRIARALLLSINRRKFKTVPFNKNSQASIRGKRNSRHANRSSYAR